MLDENDGDDGIGSEVLVAVNTVLDRDLAAFGDGALQGEDEAGLSHITGSADTQRNEPLGMTTSRPT